MQKNPITLVLKEDRENLIDRVQFPASPEMKKQIDEIKKQGVDVNETFRRFARDLIAQVSGQDPDSQAG